VPTTKSTLPPAMRTMEKKRVRSSLVSGFRFFILFVSFLFSLSLVYTGNNKQNSELLSVTEDFTADYADCANRDKPRKQKGTRKAFARRGGQTEQVKRTKILFCENKPSLPSLPFVKTGSYSPRSLPNESRCGLSARR